MINRLNFSQNNWFGRMAFCSLKFHLKTLVDTLSTLAEVYSVHMKWGKSSFLVLTNKIVALYAPPCLTHLPRLLVLACPDQLLHPPAGLLCPPAVWQKLCQKLGLWQKASVRWQQPSVHSILRVALSSGSTMSRDKLSPCTVPPSLYQQKECFSPAGGKPCVLHPRAKSQ